MSDKLRMAPIPELKRLNEGFSFHHAFSKPNDFMSITHVTSEQ